MKTSINIGGGWLRERNTMKAAKMSESRMAAKIPALWRK